MLTFSCCIFRKTGVFWNFLVIFEFWLLHSAIFDFTQKQERFVLSLIAIFLLHHREYIWFSTSKRISSPGHKLQRKYGCQSYGISSYYVKGKTFKTSNRNPGIPLCINDIFYLFWWLKSLALLGISYGTAFEEGNIQKLFYITIILPWLDIGDHH